MFNNGKTKKKAHDSNHGMFFIELFPRLVPTIIINVFLFHHVSSGKCVYLFCRINEQIL